MNKREASIRTLKKLFDEAYEMGVTHYVLQGGEPTCDLDRLEAIIRIIYPEETFLTIVSNGWNITKNLVEKLKELKIDKLSFSLDSAIKEEHDKNRLPGSYDRVMKAIDIVINEGLLCSISTVFTHHNLHTEGVRRAYEFAAEKGIRFEAQIAMPFGKWDGKKEMLVTEEDSAYIKELQKNYGKLPNGQNIIQRDLYRRDGDYCPAGKEFMAVSATGEILPCNFLQYSLGNIGDVSLKETRERLLQNKWFGEYHSCCIGGEDSRFIDEFIVPYMDYDKPLDACTVFNLKRGAK
jgi:MoaA/NifB/PqqE/SkfB family radical SAM enzyme